MSDDGHRRRAADRLLARTMARGGGGPVLLLATTSIAGAISETLLPAVLGRTVDALLAGPSPPVGLVAASGTLIAAVVACDALGQLATGASAADAAAWLRRLLCRHLLAAGPGMTRRFQTGEIVSRVMAGTTEAGAAPAAGITAAASLIPVVGAPIALILIDPWLAVAFAAGLPALALILRAFVRDTSNVVGRYLQVQGVIAARLLDALGGARTIAAAGTVERESLRVLHPLGELRASGDATWRTVGRMAAQGALLVPLLQVLVLAAGGLELAAGRISAGLLLAAIQYAGLGSGIGVVIVQLNRLARARAGAGRAAELLTVPPLGEGDLNLGPGPGRLELRGATVRREGQIALDGLDLIVPAGTAVAVVGRSGSGKSLLAALAGRLADPDRGEVLLDGVSLRRLARRDLRRAVQYAFERPALLGTTIGEAIGFGASKPTPEQVSNAAGAACADAFIRRLPRGYETPLADAPLSGGEVQRIGLARAFAHADAARLLVLDDATSSLDTATEMQVSRALTARLARRTRLIVAHRAATAARADLVAWLDAGRLRAFGPHHELWRDPAYRAVFGVDSQ